MKKKWLDTCSRLVIGGSLISNLTVGGMAAPTQKENKKPNILILWGDDIGIWMLLTPFDCPDSNGADCPVYRG
jgi:hypothetical protein